MSHPKITRHSKTGTRLATVFLHTQRCSLGAPYRSGEYNIDGAPSQSGEHNIDGAPYQSGEHNIDGVPTEVANISSIGYT